MVRIARSDSADGQQSLGDLVALAAKDISQLVHYEISLAKGELKMDARRIGIAAALAGIGLFAGCLLMVLLCFAFAYGLIAAGIWSWAAFLIVAGTCLLLIGIAALIAYTRVRKVSGMKMTRKTVTDDIGMLKQAASSANGHAPSAPTLAVGDSGKTAAGDSGKTVTAGSSAKPEIPAQR